MFFSCLIRSRCLQSQAIILQVLRIVLHLLDVRLDMKGHISECLLASNAGSFFTSVKDSTIGKDGGKERDGGKDIDHTEQDEDLSNLLERMNCVFVDFVKPQVRRFLEMDFLLDMQTPRGQCGFSTGFRTCREEKTRLRRYFFLKTNNIDSSSCYRYSRPTLLETGNKSDFTKDLVGSTSKQRGLEASLTVRCMTDFHNDELVTMQADFPGFDYREECNHMLRSRRVMRPTLPRLVLDAFTDITITDFVCDLLTLESDFDRGEIVDHLIKFDEKRFRSSEADSGVSKNQIRSSEHSVGEAVDSGIAAGAFSTLNRLPEKTEEKSNIATSSSDTQQVGVQERGLNNRDKDAQKAAQNTRGLPSTGSSSVPQHSVFSYGRCALLLLCRLDISSHYRIHEPRTPLRTHLLKFLLNIFRANCRSRTLFHIFEGTRILCTLIKGCTWGKVGSQNVEEEEELDREEEDNLYRPSQLYASQLPGQSWPYVQTFEDARYYQVDFLDDKFYGSRDRVLATAFLEHLGELWSPRALVEELMAYPYTLQTLARARDAGNLCFLISEMLTSSLFPSYLSEVSCSISTTFTDDYLGPLIHPDGTYCTIFPLVYDVGSTGTLTGISKYDGRSAHVYHSFRQDLIRSQAKNIRLRILAYAFHNFQAFIQEENERRKVETHQETADTFLMDLCCCCELLSRQIEVSGGDFYQMLVSIFVEMRSFARRALLAVNALSPVNPDERQKARTLEFAKTIPPRPMYFGHYQQLIYNQSNPTQTYNSGYFFLWSCACLFHLPSKVKLDRKIIYNQVNFASASWYW